ncbi:MAG: glycosyltransferase family A protein [Candidatus Thiodiazotropha sp.]
MASDKPQALQRFFTRYASHPSLCDLSEPWHKLSNRDQIEIHNTTLIELTDRASLFLEQELQRNDYAEDLLDLHQQLFLEMESLIAKQSTDDRHHFIVVIPVADRPQHLEACLDSLFTLCRRFGYGGFAEQKYQKIRVMIADDSKQPDNRNRHRKIAQQFSRDGLEALYFGQHEQLQLLEKLSDTQRQDLSNIIGSHPAAAFYHKGASITRNLSYLKLKQLIADDNHTLIWFIDSDQEFRINTQSHRDGVFAINYFHRLDRIYASTETLVLTGKVVGDPPVSPAVMATNFLQDVLGFVSDIARLQPQHACSFHQQTTPRDDGAAYHDMADLFGFHDQQKNFRYHCQLPGRHDQVACLTGFSRLLNHFFDGEHLTRQSFYTTPPTAMELTPARTLYTGNYLLSPQALDFFIPFSSLKLRMAGPQLGRLLRSELGSRFVSANLPLLHKRTQGQTGESEFRPGIHKGQTGIDISGEFERQFFGDVLLFSLQTLIESGYPQQQMKLEQIEQIVLDTEASLLQRYRQMQQQIMTRLEELRQSIEDRNGWWWHNPEAGDAIENFQDFMQNMAYNFATGSPGYVMIQSTTHRQQRRQQILQALRAYTEDRDNWRKALA